MSCRSCATSSSNRSRDSPASSTSSSTKIRENRDNIEKYGKALQDIGRFIVNYIAPVLVKTLGFAFSIVSKAIGPALDAFFGFMGVLGTLGSFVIKIAETVLGAFGGDGERSHQGDQLRYRNR
jgi:hypothetical protein